PLPPQLMQRIEEHVAAENTVAPAGVAAAILLEPLLAGILGDVGGGSLGRQRVDPLRLLTRDRDQHGLVSGAIRKVRFATGLLLGRLLTGRLLLLGARLLEDAEGA